MTTLTGAELRAAYPDLTNESGGFAMLAIDQRESLRSMFKAAAGGTEVGDEVLEQFKADAVEIIARYSTGVLIDTTFGTAAIERNKESKQASLILSADVLHQERDGDLTDTSLDESITVDAIRESGATAIKMLVLWYLGSDNTRIVRQSQAFIDLAREAGVHSLLETIVRPAPGTDWASETERHAAIISAARELCALRPDIYKAQVPGYTAGDLSQVAAQSELLTAAIDTPWVVLSNGVRSDEFSESVRRSVDNGAVGFLAGRAIWADAVATGNVVSGLQNQSIDRLKELDDIVSNRGRH